MIANLPLLFSNGNPVALYMFDTGDLENFISFMVTCSWGHDTAKIIKQPPWWPDDVQFSHPFQPPEEIPFDWKNMLMQLVSKCYEYHDSTFLLFFSEHLAQYPRETLRYVDNRDHTTSIYLIPTGKLLVTFRNENLFYDKQQVPITKKTDIYLCDNCDSHFDNFDLFKSHERLCNNDNIPSSFCTGGIEEFTAALKLRPVNEKSDNITANNLETRTRTFRSASNVDRGPPYPFSSLAYLRNIKSNAQRDLTYSRERVERYCCTTAIVINKGPLGKSKNSQFPVRYRRPINYWNRKHVFTNQRNKQILSVKAQLLLQNCKPIKVNLDNMSLESINIYIEKLKEEAKAKMKLIGDIEFVGGFENEVTVEVDNHKGDPLNRNIEEVIDLCSDDESSVNENWDPKAGVTCVIRGGAVLRKTASTPYVLPDEPCGARQHALPDKILQKHQPVILFTPALVNMQTISID